MAQMQTPSSYQPAPTRPSDAWAGWITFAAVILALLGTLNVIQGFVALFDDGYFVAASGDDLLLVDYTAWGVILLCWGAILVCAGLALASGRTWARWFALAAVFVNVIVQIGFLSAYPVWSALMILFDVLVIFALTARWHEARAAM
jgi:hypothetical protein